MNRNQFRWLVVAVALGHIAFLLSSIFTSSLIPESIRAAELAHSRQAPTGMYTAILAGITALAFIVVIPVSFVGLYRFRRWSLGLNVALLAIDPLLPLLTGESYLLISWVDATLSEWTNAGLGAALGIAYFSPLRSEFK